MQKLTLVSFLVAFIIRPSAFVESSQCFESTTELYDAVDAYLSDNSQATNVAATYGWPINTWCVSQITDFSEVFSTGRNGAAAFFNEPLDQWNMSSATNMRSMFAGASQFQSDLSMWDMSSARDIGYMFARASSFRAGISKWNVSSVKYTPNTFFQATSFNVDISGWDVRNAENMESMFAGAAMFSQNLCSWGAKLRDSVIVDSPFGEQYSMFRGTNCPSLESPNMTAIPPGPFCYVCSSASTSSSSSPDLNVRHVCMAVVSVVVVSLFIS